MLDAGEPLVVTVDVRSEEESLRLTAQKIEPLDAVVADAAAGLRVFLGEVRALRSLKSVIAREAGGRGRVTVVLDLPSREVEIAIPGGFKVDPQNPRRGQIAARDHRRPRHLSGRTLRRSEGYCSDTH